ncbi:MAG: hypothetical protein V4864_25425 [Pseudomonadota bacterium]
MFAISLSARTPRARASISLAFMRRLGGAAVRWLAPRAPRHDAGADLAQRVRESGEW